MVVIVTCHVTYVRRGHVRVSGTGGSVRGSRQELPRAARCPRGAVRRQLDAHAAAAEVHSVPQHRRAVV